MRLWSLHPKYLDRMGLLALWREGLLAQKVLLGRTRGYRFHPQLDRFRACNDPVLAIGCYLHEVLKEAERRGYRFDGSKIAKKGRCRKIRVRKGQIDVEWARLLGKLLKRDRERYAMNRALARPLPHPLFTIVSGGIEAWERV
ncbi:MAG: pyrimidine dimer DNA glycosylase/endonuclease V [Nitrospiraceae bacterium]|nr:pyrimidine dimer DNA glycosylase/endonuclease V [Nitrospiraceae bacterium]